MPLPTNLEFSQVSFHGNHVLIVRINRPNQLNSLHPLAHKELSEIWDYYQADPQLWVAILTGNGKAFSAGFDLQYAAGRASQKGKNKGELTEEKKEKEMLEEGPQTGFGGIVLRDNCSKPIIAAVNGIAFGGGFELALACDIVIASEQAEFALPEAKVGLAALAGGLARLPRVIGIHNAMGMILTGKRVSAQEGFRLGFVNDVVPHDQLLATALKYADMIMACSPDSIKASKKCVLEGLKEPDVIQAIIKSQDYPEVRKMLKGENFIEGVTAFAQKRKPNWKSSL